MVTLRDKRLRSIAKSVVYRALSIVVDSVVAYFFTRDVFATFSIVIFVNSYSTLLYYAHERVWARIPWGKGK